MVRIALPWAIGRTYRRMVPQRSFYRAAGSACQGRFPVQFRPGDIESFASARTRPDVYKLPNDETARLKGAEPLRLGNLSLIPHLEQRIKGARKEDIRPKCRIRCGATNRVLRRLQKFEDLRV
jgi:hypothetical protein